MNFAVIMIVMIAVMCVLAFVTLAVILANNMTFDDVVDETGDLVKVIPNQSSRVVTQLIEGG